MACKECCKIDLQSHFKMYIKVAYGQVKGKWCTQDGDWFALSLLTLLLDARCCLRVSLPHILFPIISPLLTIHLSKVTSDIVTPFIKIFHVCLMVYYWAEYRGDLGCLSSLSHCCLWDADLGPVCFCPYSLNGYWALLPLCLSFWIALLQEYISVLPHCWPWLCSSFLFSQLSHF